MRSLQQWVQEEWYEMNDEYRQVSDRFYYKADKWVWGVDFYASREKAVSLCWQMNSYYKQQMQKIIRVSIWRLNPQRDMQNATMLSNMTALRMYDGEALTEEVSTCAFLLW